MSKNYKKVGNFYRLYNRNDFICFIKDKQKDFDCIEDSENWFGYRLNSNDDTGEILETVEEWAEHNKFRDEPKIYPCTVYYVNESNYGRFGKESCIIFDYIEDNEWLKEKRTVNEN